mmetsp:Transcript_28757/g.66804  ORF Transcript_28757/g.66804 Transcript_28757/m.66804 type:complete len:218 (-) Transcript_28757:1202-1855(-)
MPPEVLPLLLAALAENDCDEGGGAADAEEKLESWTRLFSRLPPPPPPPPVKLDDLRDGKSQIFRVLSLEAVRSLRGASCQQSELTSLRCASNTKPGFPASKSKTATVPLGKAAMISLEELDHAMADGAADTGWIWPMERPQAVEPDCFTAQSEIPSLLPAKSVPVDGSKSSAEIFVSAMASLWLGIAQSCMAGRRLRSQTKILPVCKPVKSCFAVWQ